MKKASLIGAKMRINGLTNEHKVINYLKRKGWKNLHLNTPNTPLYDAVGEFKETKYYISIKSDANENGVVSNLSIKDKQKLKTLAQKNGVKAVIIRLKFVGSTKQPRYYQEFL